MNIVSHSSHVNALVNVNEHVHPGSLLFTSSQCDRVS